MTTATEDSVLTERSTTLTADDFAGLAQEDGKGPVVTLITANTDEPTEVAYTGTIMYVAPQGLQLKFKGRAKTKLILMHEIKSVTVAKSDLTFKPKRLAVYLPPKVRQHLLDHHGMTIEFVKGLSEEQAVALHDSIHAESVVGHYHAAPEVKS